MKVAGIDVGSQELVLVIRDRGGAGKARVFSNTDRGHEAIRKVLGRAKVERVCIEATGVYHLDLAVVLSGCGELEVMVVNPKAAKRFAEANMTRGKTDVVDATLLSEFAERMPFTAWRRPSEAALAVRACARRLAALGKQRTQAKNQLHAWRATQITPQFIVNDVVCTIAQLDRQIDSLKEKTLQLIGADEALSETLTLLLSVKGIAETSAIQIMGELLVLPEDMSARQWVAMAGLDPRIIQSGTLKKKTQISKVGNRYLRLALYMPALSAAQHDPYVKGYYQHLIHNRGLKKLQSLCAVMRKLLHAIHGMLKSKTRFDNTRFFNLQTHTAN